MLNLVREVLAVYHPTVNFHIIFLKDVAFALIKKRALAGLFLMSVDMNVFGLKSGSRSKSKI